jgi:TonB family protein
MITLLTSITIIFAAVWALTALLGRASAATRHMIWTCAFAAVLLLAPLRWRAPHRVIATTTIPPIPVIVSTTVAAAPSPRPIDLTAILLAIWAAGTGLLLLRLIRNAIQLRAIVNTASGRRPVLSTANILGPLATGILRPVILLPDSASTWTFARRRAVLAHETAHVRRRDPAILFAAHLATAIYWFHPLAWLAIARLRAESERACDDAALRIGLRPSHYANDLLELARRFETQLAIPMATTSHLESRVKSILDPMTNRSFPARAAWLTAIALTASVLIPLATFTLRAQQFSGTATLMGYVFDPTGAVVARAQVTAINAETGAKQTIAANASGCYTFADLPAGYYSIEVRVPGFAAYRHDNQAVVGGGTVWADDARLNVGSISERILVAAPGIPQPRTAPINTTGRIRVGGNIQATALVQQVKPVYPPDLQARGVEGTVLLSAVISKDGAPVTVQVVKSPGQQQFVDAALTAVNQWRYKPTLLNGEPVEVLTNIQIDFKLGAVTP